jgi:predicted nucleic acid-binding protein
MTLGPSARTFIDTNVLVYAHDRSETRKQPIAQALLERLWATRTGILSTQVLQEFYSVATRRFNPPMSPREAREIVALYGTWQLVQVDLPLIIAASGLHEQRSLSFWDALVVEAAVRAGADQLSTEDLQHGRRFGGVEISNPFVGTISDTAPPQPSRSEAENH